jgi:hypothetical protein
VRKSGIQREKSGYCGQGEKSQFKLHVNSCWVGCWSDNKAEAWPLAFTFVVLTLEVPCPIKDIIQQAWLQPQCC